MLRSQGGAGFALTSLFVAFYRCGMAYDYELLYRETPHALGEPTQAFVDFFNRLDASGLSVLDVGCGQGRDALFIARLGHSVTGVDLSSSGIEQLGADAVRENLPIRGVVADLEHYAPEEDFDIVLIDRTLHMLDEPVRLDLLKRLLPAVKAGGWLLIADEKSNIAGFQNVLDDHSANWVPVLAKRGYLFVKRD
ncbi:class I SAM-dependent methyltransferase [Roseibium sp.]|uniref:class I SAM-dependent methyltransferase n=1 Tax=Roseibium sp. TaxID=1936156 RepID=UPI003BAFFE17